MSKGLTLINNVFPKANLIVFNSFPDINGNALSLYEYILKERKDIVSKYKLVWAVANMTKDEANAILCHRTNCNHHNIVLKKGIDGIFAFLRAKYVVSTHGYFPSVSLNKNQQDINLWHGMPFKRIGLMLEEGSDAKYGNEQFATDFGIATSEIFQNIMSQSFGVVKERIHITGQPCNDVLVSKSNALHKLGITKKYKKVIVWLPTYRKSVVGIDREDGKADAFGVAVMLQQYFEELNSLLREKEYLLIVKPHPMDAICSMKFKESTYIKVYQNSDLAEKYIQLYDLLAESDLLLTDYSSVFIDYMITDKPIAFVCDDLDQYGNSRGFCFENPRKYMPGTLLTCPEDLFTYFKDVDSINAEWNEIYKNIQKQFNRYCDGNSSKRVCDLIWKADDKG